MKHAPGVQCKCLPIPGHTTGVEGATVTLVKQLVGIELVMHQTMSGMRMPWWVVEIIDGPVRPPCPYCGQVHEILYPEPYLQPQDPDVSWDAIEKMTGWNPKKVEEERKSAVLRFRNYRHILGLFPPNIFRP